MDAAFKLISRWGVAKTTMADVAKVAGVSRATVYRQYPGGKQQLFSELGLRELAGYLASVEEALTAADEFEEALTMGLVVGSRLITDNEAAQFVMEHEPEILLPFVGFQSVNIAYEHVTEVLAPSLYCFLPEDQAAWAVEWCCRLLLSQLLSGEDHWMGNIDRTRELVVTFIKPAFAEHLNG